MGGTPPEDMAAAQAPEQGGGQGSGSPQGSQNAFSKYQKGGDEPEGMTPPGDNID